MPKSKTFNTKYGELLRNTFVPDHVSDEEAWQLRQPLIEMVKQNMPRKLYRYRSCNEHSIDAFRKNRIYFNTPNNFNDPHDCLVYFDYKRIQQEIESTDVAEYVRIIKTLRDNREIPKIFNEVFPSELIEEMLALPSEDLTQKADELQNNFDRIIASLKNEIENICYNILFHFKDVPKLACFSQNIKEPLMWSYYADSHKGFALEYDFTNFSYKCANCSDICDNFAVHDLFPIVYTNTRYDATDFALMLMIEKIHNSGGFQALKTKYTSIPDRLAVQKANTYKATCWRHEKEWRMKLLCKSNSQRNWLECKPKAIYLGSSISELYRDVLLKYAKENSIIAYQMDIQPLKREHKMNHTKIKL